MVNAEEQTLAKMLSDFLRYKKSLLQVSDIFGVAIKNKVSSRVSRREYFAAFPL